jgi:Pentapeptide repeats (8 copies)
MELRDVCRGATGGLRRLSVVVACVLVGVLWMAGSASASSRGFLVHNYADRALRVERVTSVPADPGVFYHFGFEGRPADGAVLGAKDDVQDWQLKYEFGRSYAARVVYKIDGTGGTVAFRIQSSTLSNDSTCDVAGTTGYFCTAEGLVLTVRKGGPKCLAGPAERVDWAGCDLRGSDLGGARLGRADLRGTNLSYSMVQHAHLAHADLTGADLHGAQFDGADLQSADLRRANLQSAYFPDVDFRDADLSGLDLSGTSLVRAELQGANLTGVKLVQYSLYLSRCNYATIWPNGTTGHGNACPTGGGR